MTTTIEPGEGPSGSSTPNQVSPLHSVSALPGLDRRPEYRCEKCDRPMPDGNRAVCIRCRHEEAQHLRACAAHRLEIDDDAHEDAEARIESEQMERNHDE